MKNLRRIGFTLATLGLLAVSGAAAAQMNGGGRGMGGGPPAGGMGPDAGGRGMGGGPVLVAPDGKVLLVKETVTTTGTTTTVSSQLSAVSTAGTVAWTYAASSPIRGIALPTGLVAFSVETPGTATASATASVVALNLGSGAQAWSLAVDGNVADLTANGTGLNAVVVKHAAPTGTATQGTTTHTLVSITAAGKVAWSLSLD